MDAGGAVEQEIVVKEDAAFIGAHESGNGIEDKRFSGTAGAEQNGDAGGRLKFQVERKSG